MKLTSNSTARRRTANAPALSLGGPQIPSPVIRIAPKPRRWTESSPPKDTSPAELAEIFFSFATVLLFTKTSGKFVVSQFDRPKHQDGNSTADRTCPRGPVSETDQTRDT